MPAPWSRGSHTVHIAVDGAFGPETEGATQVFQAAQNVIVDGLVGPLTRAALVDALALVEQTEASAQTVAPSEGATPAAGICDRADGELATIAFEADTAGPRCLIVSPTEQLRVENGDRATTVELAGWTADLAPGETATIGPPFAEYLAPGVHTVHVSTYGGSGPQLWLMG